MVGSLFLVSLSVFCSLASGTGTTPISLPYHSTAHLNCTAMINVDLCQDPRGSCYAGGDFIPSNTSVSNCCPVTVSVTSSVKGRPTRSALGVSCEIGCGKQAVNACSWELHFTGIAPVSSLSYNDDTEVLSWSPPSFFSDDIPQGEDPVYNILVNDISIINTTNTNVSLSFNNCSAAANISVITLIGTYQSSKNETLKNNVCNVTLLNNTEFYNLTQGKFGTTIAFQFECNIKVCSFTGFVYGYGDGTVEYSFEVHVPPSDDKSVTASHIINGLSPGSYTIEISFNSTKDTLNFTITVPSNPEETSDDPINPTSFPNSSISATTSSVSEGSNGFETISSNVAVNETSTGSPPLPDGDLTFTDIAIYFSTAVAALVLLCILLCVCRQVYYSCVKKEPEAVEKKRDSNDDSSAATETNSHNSTTERVVTTPTAIEMQEVTESGSNHSTDISESDFNATKQNLVLQQGEPHQEASTVLSEERSYLEGADNCESSQNNNMEDGGNPAADTNYVMPEQTLSSDHEQPLSFAQSQQVPNRQTKSTNKMNGLELETMTKELKPD